MFNPFTTWAISWARRKQNAAAKPLAFMCSPRGRYGPSSYEFSWGESAADAVELWQARGVDVPILPVSTMPSLARRLNRAKLRVAFADAGLRLVADIEEAGAFLEDLLDEHVVQQQQRSLDELRTDVAARVTKLIGNSAVVVRADTTSPLSVETVAVTADSLVSASGLIKTQTPELGHYEQLRTTHLRPKETKVAAHAVLLAGQTVHVTADLDGSVVLTVAGHSVSVRPDDADEILTAVARVATVARV